MDIRPPFLCRRSRWECSIPSDRSPSGLPRGLLSSASHSPPVRWPRILLLFLCLALSLLPPFLRPAVYLLPLLFVNPVVFGHLAPFWLLLILRLPRLRIFRLLLRLCLFLLLLAWLLLLLPALRPDKARVRKLSVRLHLLRLYVLLFFCWLVASEYSLFVRQIS
ncbi:hypothetical protein K450DRAFT_222248 [Umbelopsis ramanniana AG]|uniref:Transmembrane protein n=1 Tax=Umbelopsis ramanniana AG TaxID=1314678 RepID=A0AAD5EHM3_UMBRA|nr:uncharacterized protein K450DRAFT_222248 [Umbelopsis ramanniana AG]KAI8583674.1 hypothetical protein K450DRAFT_222248 [Umbelopsis ramanniana AG]